uniref:Uncharacterized protein n=1 Tax=Romanomermis culicivorax TaxID=13658 RepID=A0A915K9J5_ROMCU
MRQGANVCMRSNDLITLSVEQATIVLDIYFRRHTKPKDTKKSIDRYMVLTKIGQTSGINKKTPKKASPPKRTDEHGSVVVGESLMSNESPTSFPKQGDGVAPPDDEEDDEKGTSYKSKARSKRPNSKRASKRTGKRTITKKAFKKLAASDVQSTFDFVNSKYGKKTCEDAAKRRRIMLAVGAVVVLMLLSY